MLIRRSKSDQEGQGQTIAIPRGAQLRPVATLQEWLHAAEITVGPVFRRMPTSDLPPTVIRLHLASTYAGLGSALDNDNNHSRSVLRDPVADPCGQRTRQ